MAWDAHHDNVQCTCTAGAEVTLPPTEGDATVFSVIVVPAADAVVAAIEVSCTSARSPDGLPASTRLEPVPLSNGTVAWHDAAHQFMNVPGWMLGATLFRGPHRGPTGGSALTVRAAAPSVVYVIVEEEFEGGPGRSANLLPDTLPENKWERRHEAPVWNVQSKLAVYARRVKTREALTTPEIGDVGSAGCVMALVVKVDVEGFDASVHSNTGIEYGCAEMEESTVVWSDCQNRYVWVPECTKGGILFRGPQCVPDGTVVHINASGAFRAYVIVETEYEGGQARSGGFPKALVANKWTTQPGPPSWGDKKSTMKVYTYMVPEGVELHLPATSGSALFSIVVVGISAVSDRLADELKRVFKAWDSAGEGGIQRRDLDAFLVALCPGLDPKGKQALMDSMDRSKSGFLSYEEFINKVLVPR